MSLVRGTGEYRTLYDFSIVSNPDYLESNGKITPNYLSVEDMTTIAKELFACGICFNIASGEDSKVGKKTCFGPIKEWAVEYRRLPIISILVESSRETSEWIELIGPSKDYFHIFNKTYQKVSLCHSLMEIVQKYPLEPYEEIINRVCTLFSCE